MEQSIKELKALRDNIDQRIKVLTEKSGGDIFEERLYPATEEIKKLVADRRENEDIKSLWEIYFELSALEGSIIRTISGYDE